MTPNTFEAENGDLIDVHGYDPAMGLVHCVEFRRGSELTLNLPTDELRELLQEFEYVDY